MTDKHSSKNFQLNVSGISYCFNFEKHFFLRITAFQQKRTFFVFRYSAFVPNGYNGNNQNMTVVLQMFQAIKIWVRIRLTNRRYSRLFIVELCSYHL